MLLRVLHFTSDLLLLPSLFLEPKDQIPAPVCQHVVQIHPIERQLLD